MVSLCVLRCPEVFIMVSLGVLRCVVGCLGVIGCSEVSIGVS